MTLILLSLLACGETSPESLVDELRVIASVVNPPEVEPGADFEVQTFFANPEGGDARAVTWVCTNLGDGCLEAAGGSSSLQSTSTEGDADTWTHDHTITDFLTPVVAEAETLTATQLWTLYCEADLCPLIDEVAALEPTAAWPDGLHDQLANPLEWMTELPMEGVSLAYQLITTSVTDTPHANPVIEPDSDNPTELKRGKDFELTVDVSGDFSDQAEFYNYISAGGFKNSSLFITDNQTLKVEGVAPKSGDSVTIWLVLVDGFGGIAVWTQAFPVN